MKIGSTISIFFLLSWTIANSQSMEGLQNINGTQLFISEEGKGEPVIIIHGGPGLNYSYFKPHLAPLAKNFKVLYYDQRASGQSAIPAVDSLSLSFFVDDIEGIRNALGVKKVNLLAHSWGALLAVQYGMKYPDQVRKLILVAPVPLNQSYQKEIKEFQTSHFTKQDSLDRAAIMNSNDFKNGNISAYENILKLAFRPTFYNTKNFSKLNLTIPDNFMEANQALYTGITKDLSTYDFYEDVKAFSFPVLVVAGAADGIPMSALQKINENLPSSEFVIFKKSGHFPFIEEPEKFSQTIATFLKSKH